MPFQTCFVPVADISDLWFSCDVAAAPGNQSLSCVTWSLLMRAHMHKHTHTRILYNILCPKTHTHTHVYYIIFYVHKRTHTHMYLCLCTSVLQDRLYTYSIIFWICIRMYTLNNMQNKNGWCECLGEKGGARYIVYDLQECWQPFNRSCHYPTSM